MKTWLVWKRLLAGCFVLAMIAGCASMAPESSTSEPTLIPTSIPTDTPEPTVIPTSMPTDTPEPTAIPTSTPTDTPEPTVLPLRFLEGTEFPIGVFRSANGKVAVEFREDGVSSWYSESEGWRVSGRYGVNGDLFSEMSFYFDTGLQVPVTYYWTFDGEKLRFRLWGEDLRPHRKSVIDGQTYRFSEGTEAASKVEAPEFPTGRFVLDGPGFYAIEFDEDGTWRDSETNGVVSGGGKYATNGNLYTEMTHSHPDSRQVPATYQWTYDGKNLTFRLCGRDVNAYRASLFDGRTYAKAE